LNGQAFYEAMTDDGLLHAAELDWNETLCGLEVFARVESFDIEDFDSDWPWCPRCERAVEEWLHSPWYLDDEAE
jgi:hypothetical protein